MENSDVTKGNSAKNGSQKKYIVVTGGNTGIGYALCKQLVLEDNCFVFMGSRDLIKGTKALDELVKAYPEAKDNILLVQIDTSDPESIAASAKAVQEVLEDKGVKLYGLVNNAGTGISHNVKKDVMF